MRNLYKWLLVCFFLLIFLFLAVELVENKLLIFDQSVYNFISSIMNPFWTSFFKIVTNFANLITFIIICFFSFFFFKDRKNTYYIYLNLANVVLLNFILKEIFGRSRPSDIMLITETGYSFPSGHSMAAMAFYGFLIYLIHKMKWQQKTKITFTIILSILILLIGISRIYLGVHYASDVIAGFSISLVYLIIYITIIEKVGRKYEEKK